MMQVKWCGVDFGQCLMEPTGLRTYLVIGDVYKESGRPEQIPKAVKRFREVVEAYGGHSPLKESHRDKIHSYVFEGDDELMAVFGVKEKEHLSVGVGAEEALKYMNEQGIDVNIVAELKKTIPYYALRFVSKPGLTGWAQVNYRYGASEEDAVEKLQYELHYLQEMSIYLNLIILARTVSTVLFHRGS